MLEMRKYLSKHIAKVYRQHSVFMSRKLAVSYSQQQLLLQQLPCKKQQAGTSQCQTGEQSNEAQISPPCQQQIERLG